MQPGLSCPKFSLSSSAVAPHAKSSLFKGKYSAKRKVRKVKEARLKVTLLPKMMSTVPPPKERQIQEVWVPITASEEEVSDRIRSAVGWKADEKPLYLYAQGKNLRPANLTDIEGADSWDIEAVRALMGNGCLYIVKPAVPTSPTLNSDSDPEVSI